MIGSTVPNTVVHTRAGVGDQESTTKTRNNGVCALGRSAKFSNHSPWLVPLRRTPAPLPFVNSIPADSKARLSAVTVELWAASVPGEASSRLMVGNDTPEA